MDKARGASYPLRMRLADLLAPVSIAEFEADYLDKRPLHVPCPGGGAAKAPIGWDGLNALLAIRSHWSEANLKLVMNSRPVQPDFYLEEVETLGGQVRRAVPAKVDVFLAMGASLVANSVEDVSPAVAAIGAVLAEHLGGKAGANLYCSFAEVQAFASHCDLHEVFAIQCEGEKNWNIYANRAASPVEPLVGDDAQAVIDAAKGPVAMQVRMRPGDLLYIPRGYYHDALASSEASLHVTFGVAPLSGRILFRLLETMAMEEEPFRAYLPDARRGGGAPLRERLSDLASRLAALAGSERMANEIADRQAKLREPVHGLALPARRQLRFFARSQAPASLARDAAGARLMLQSGASIALGGLADAAEWLLDRPGFAVEELAANFRHVPAAELEALVHRLEQAGLVFAYRPARG